MDFTVTEAAKTKLDAMLQERGLTDVFFVMDYVDGDSPFYEGMVGCHCQVYDKYHLVVLKKEQKEIFLQSMTKFLRRILGKWLLRATMR